MKYFKLLTSAICLICVFVLVERAHGWVYWYGFSDLCFEGEFKGGPKDGYLKIDLIDFTVQVQCYNISTGDMKCLPGLGNSGQVTISTKPSDSAYNKETGTLYVSGCIDLSEYDDHYAEDHTHICWPYDNKNMVEFSDSAWVPRIDVNWYLMDSNDKVKLRGVQSCTYPYSINQDTCLPPHSTDENKLYFLCPIDLEFKK